MKISPIPPCAYRGHSTAHQTRHSHSRSETLTITHSLTLSLTSHSHTHSHPADSPLAADPGRDRLQREWDRETNVQGKRLKYCKDQPKKPEGCEVQRHRNTHTHTTHTLAVHATHTHAHTHLQVSTQKKTENAGPVKRVHTKSR